MRNLSRALIMLGTLLAAAPALAIRWQDDSELRASPSPRRYLDALKASHRPQVRPASIMRERPSTFGYVPGVANLAGAFGSYFTTDLFIVNPHPLGDAIVDLYFLPNGRDNVAQEPPGIRFTLPAFNASFSRNVLQREFGLIGGGALFWAVDDSSTGTSDTISMWAYTSTPGPDGGRYGSSIHGVGETWSDNLFDGWCVGAQWNVEARTNIGILNRGTLPLTIHAEIVTTESQSGEMTINVPAGGFLQVPLGTRFDFSAGLIFLEATTSNTGWIAYMAVVDNVTNDFNFQYSTGW